MVETIVAIRPIARVSIIVPELKNRTSLPLGTNPRRTIQRGGMPVFIRPKRSPILSLRRISAGGVRPASFAE